MDEGFGVGETGFAPSIDAMAADVTADVTAANAPRVLNIGAGSNPMKGAVNLDLKPGPGVDVVADANALPFEAGAFDEVHAINPYKFNPVSSETARVLSPGGLLRVSGTPRNPYAQPLSPDAAGIVGYEVVGTSPLAPEHQFGVQRFTSGTPLSTESSITTTYRKLQ